MIGKAIGTIFVVLTALAAPASAQEVPASVPDYSFSGLTGALWNAGLSDLNDALTDAAYPELQDLIALYGQGTTLGSEDGLRVGFYLRTGETSGTSGEDRTSRLLFTLGGALVEWGRTLERGASMAFGLALGGGTSTLTLVDHTPESFDDALAEPFRTELARWIYSVTPSVSAHERPLDGFDLKLRVGYLFTIGCHWTANATPLSRQPALAGGPIVEASFAIDLRAVLAGWSDETSAPPEEARD